MLVLSFGKNGSIIKISIYANHKMILPLPKLIYSLLKLIQYKQYKRKVHLEILKWNFIY